MKKQCACTIIGILVLIVIQSPICHAEFGWKSVEIHGFLSQGYMESRGNNVFADTLKGTFQFNEVGLNFSTDLTHQLHLGLQFLSRDIGDFDNNTIELDWAFADYRWRDWLGFRAGRIRSPGGLHMETIDFDMLRTYIFLPQSIYSDSMRDTLIAVNGIGVYGYVPLGGLGDLTYQALYGETGIATDGTMAMYMESEANSRLIDVKSHPVLRLHAEWMPPFEGIRLAGSMMLTDIELRYVTTEQTFWASEIGIPVGWEFPYLMDNMMIVGTGLEIVRERLVFLAEYEYLETNVTQDREEWERYRSAGGYIGLTYRFTDRFDLGTYYSVYYDDLDDRKGEQYEAAGLPNYAAWQKDWTVTVRVDMNEYWILKGEIHVIDGTALLLNQHNPEGTERESVLFAVKATYSF